MAGNRSRSDSARHAELTAYRTGMPKASSDLVMALLSELPLKAKLDLLLDDHGKDCPWCP